jgi:hypothetical protein
LELVDCFLGVIEYLLSNISLDKLWFCVVVVEIDDLPVVIDVFNEDCDGISLSFEYDSIVLCLDLISCEIVDWTFDVFCSNRSSIFHITSWLSCALSLILFDLFNSIADGIWLDCDWRETGREANWISLWNQIFS